MSCVVVMRRMTVTPAARAARPPLLVDTERATRGAPFTGAVAKSAKPVFSGQVGVIPGGTSRPIRNSRA
jgi:hypothetical protein